MLIHVFDDTPHHYEPMRRFFSEQCQIEQAQQFWARIPREHRQKNSNQKSSNQKGSSQKDSSQNGSSQKNCTTTAVVQFYRDNDELLLKLAKLPQNAQVLFHGLFELYLWRKLIFMAIASRSSCVFWGAELYRHGGAGRTIKQHLAQIIHQLLVFRFKHVISLNPGDALLIQKYLKRSNVRVLPYPLIGLVKPKEKPQELVNNNEQVKPIKILIGNSAAASNEHSFAFKKIAHLASNNIEVIVPLNYAGKDNYVRDIIDQGRELFGDKFTPITDMLAKDAYDELLASVDMTIFAHQRQQGLYVAYAMLLMGKPMFLCATTSSFTNLQSLGFSVYRSEDLDNYSYDSLIALAHKPNKTNQSLMDQYFTEAALAPKWSLFLNGLCCERS